MKTNKLFRLLIVFSVYAISLVIFRIWFTQEFSYVFLLWNLFLAYVPLLISQFIQHRRLGNFSFLIAFIVWLLYLPNAPYIITDIFHLTNRSFGLLWFDLLLVFSFAINGMILFFISTYQMHAIFSKKFSRRIAWLNSTCVMFLSGFGIYLGRFLRFNSWDILSNPKPLFFDILDRFIHPFAHLKTWGFTFGYGLFFLLGFLILKTLAQNYTKTISIYNE